MLKSVAIQSGASLVLLSQGLTASGQSLPAPVAISAVLVQPQDTNPFPMIEEQLHKQYPEYIGFEVYGDTLYLAVNSTDPAVRLQILRAVQAGHNSFLQVLGARPGQVRFLQGSGVKYLAAADDALNHIRGRTFSQFASRLERVVVGLQHPSQRDEAEAVFRAAGVPLDAVVIFTLPPRALPTGPALNAPLAAKLSLPGTVRQGKTLPISLLVRNTGSSVVAFEYGACDFHMEVRRVATKRKEIVLPVPSMEVCLTIGYQATFEPGQTKALASAQWTVETMDWKKLPPGEYELRATFGPLLGVGSDQGQPYLLPAPVKFKVLRR
ncbi:hypothetical protein [Deinococcus sp. QL22]|uniref:hypothetical protein n=1 Tax=Deinococcus sp. QL22 TaxID=2939437 RepID=UPI002017A459|nr:hypothetical protein [Deinococcus sp. QL22]UQN10608.1 hypothetical protein M1R55_30910 [Deinococcus sp. QL22]